MGRRKERLLKLILDLCFGACCGILVGAGVISCGEVRSVPLENEREPEPYYRRPEEPEKEKDRDGVLRFQGEWKRTKRGYRLIKIHEYREKSE